MVDEVIPVVRVTDADRAVEWYRRLGFEQEWVHRFASDLPAFVSMARGGARVFLSEHAGDASADTLLYLRVTDVDALASDLGAQIREQPWAREIEVQDPDGNRLRIGTPRR